MKFILLSILFFGASFSKQSGLPIPLSPLGIYSPAWNNPKYVKCNTAAEAAYLSDKEKEFIYIINLFRMDPALFQSTVIKKYPDQAGAGYLKNIKEYKSLYEAMEGVEPLPLLYPDPKAAASAFCHAQTSGKVGYVGHTRQDESCIKQQFYDGECCEYGHSAPLDILMALLIDQDVPSLGHRRLCLSSYNKIGVSIQPHSGYRINTVIDFKF